MTRIITVEKIEKDESTWGMGYPISADYIRVSFFKFYSPHTRLQPSVYRGNIRCFYHFIYLYKERNKIYYYALRSIHFLFHLVSQLYISIYSFFSQRVFEGKQFTI